MHLGGFGAGCFWTRVRRHLQCSRNLSSQRSNNSFDICRLFPVKSDKNFWAPKPLRPPYCLLKLNQQQTFLFHLRLKPGSKSSRLAQLTRSGPVSQIAVQTMAPSFSYKRVWPLATCRDKQTHLFFKIIEYTYDSVNTWIDCTTK